MHDDPTSIPPLPLKITASALVALFIILPIVSLILMGELGSIPVIVLGGLTFVGFMLGLMFVHRIILWIHYRFYWYVMAAWYVVLAVFAYIVIVPTITPLQIATVNRLPLWGQSLLVPGAIVGIVALVLVFRHGRLPSPPNNAPPIPTGVNPPPAPNKPTQMLSTAQQIAARKSNLGIDDRSKP